MHSFDSNITKSVLPRLYLGKVTQKAALLATPYTKNVLKNVSFNYIPLTKVHGTSAV